MVSYDIIAIRDTSKSKGVKVIDVYGIPLFFGMALGIYEGNGYVVSLKYSMKNPHKYTPILIISLAVLTVIFCFFGLISYEVYIYNIYIFMYNI